MRRRGPSREAGDGEVEAAPEEMNRAGLALEAGAEPFEYGDDPGQSGVKAVGGIGPIFARRSRSEEHTSELQSLMRISYAVFCLKKKSEEITSNLKKSNK